MSKAPKLSKLEKAKKAKKEKINKIAKEIIRVSILLAGGDKKKRS